MLRKLAIAISVLVLSLAGINDGHADVDAGCSRAVGCTVTGGGSETSGSVGTGSSGEPGTVAPPRICSFNGMSIPCNNAHGSWVDIASSWCRPIDDPPPMTDAVWEGNTDGSIESCTRPILTTADPGFTAHRWLPPGIGAEAPPNPEEIAWRLLAQIQLQPIQIGTDSELNPPDRDYLSAVVHGHVWLWVENPTIQTWGPIADSATERGMTVDIQAQVREVVWDMGDGSTFSCGLGRKAPPWRTLDDPSPSCGHMYEQMGWYTVTATTHWDVTWSGGGRSGTIDFSTTAEGVLNVGEVQVLITGYGNP